MSERNKQALYFVIALVAVAIYLWWLDWRGAPERVIDAPPEANFTNPYEWPNGIYPGPGNMNGGNPFESIINVNVDVPNLGWLNQTVFPMFGLVGVTAM